MGAQFDRIPRKQLQRVYEVACQVAGTDETLLKDLETVRTFFKLKALKP